MLPNRPPLSPKGIKALNNFKYTGKMTGSATSWGAIGVVAGAALLGAKAIRSAKKKTDKEIDRVVKNMTDTNIQKAFDYRKKMRARKKYSPKVRTRIKSKSK